MASGSYTLAKAKERGGDIPRRNLRAGMVAKLIFGHTAAPSKLAERLWVKITRIEYGVASYDRAVTYVGDLIDDPCAFEEDELKFGDEVWFGPEHVTEWDVSA